MNHPGRGLEVEPFGCHVGGDENDGATRRRRIGTKPGEDILPRHSTEPDARRFPGTPGNTRKLLSKVAHGFPGSGKNQGRFSILKERSETETPGVPFPTGRLCLFDQRLQQREVFQHEVMA